MASLFLARYCYICIYGLRFHFSQLHILLILGETASICIMYMYILHVYSIYGFSMCVTHMLHTCAHMSLKSLSFCSIPIIISNNIRNTVLTHELILHMANVT